MTQSEKKSICIILGTAHGNNVQGKHSPDGQLKEWRWSREICFKLRKQLQDDGYRCIIDHEGDDEIGLNNRVQIVSNYCSYFGSKNVVYVSVHVNAAKSDGQWHSAQGWQCHICKNASDKSKKLASLLYEEIEKRGIKTRRPKKSQDYWENDFYVLKHTPCPAVLTENMFMDSKDDVNFLLSKEGKDTIVNAHAEAIRRYVTTLIVK